MKKKLKLLIKIWKSDENIQRQKELQNSSEAPKISLFREHLCVNHDLWHYWTKLSWGTVYTWLNSIDHIPHGHLLMNWRPQGSAREESDWSDVSSCRKGQPGFSLITCQKISHISTNKEKTFEERILSCCSKNSKEIMQNSPKHWPLVEK